MWTSELAKLPRQRALPVSNRLRGLPCLRLNRMISKPVVLDLRCDNIRRINQLLDCMAATPSRSFPRMLLRRMEDRVKFWDVTWGTVYVKALRVFNHKHPHATHLTGGIIGQLFHLIDKGFWGGSVYRVIKKRKWAIHCETQEHHEDIDASTYPCANIVVNRASKKITLQMQRHRGYWPVYPILADGVRVENFNEHVCHVVAHEIVHVVRAVLNLGGDTMYNTNPDHLFNVLNFWAYGHTDWADEENI